MRIGITINEVFRDTLNQVHHVYEKYVAAADVEYNDIKTDNLSEYFKFSSDENYQKFLYESASVEIFGCADQMDPKLFEYTNDFLFDFYADKSNSITLISKEFNRSVTATYFWLSKVNSGFRTIDLKETYDGIWDDYDLIITTTPDILNSKPDGKISIKIDAPYNKDIDADYSFANTNPLFEEDGVLNKIIKENK